MSAAPVFIALNPPGLALARRLAPGLSGAEVHGLAGRTKGADRHFTDTLAHLRSLFALGHPLIGVCASGILIRAIAPLLSDKIGEPPVLALAADGSAVVPLIGGHRGGNRLAALLGEALAIRPALTTGGEVAFGLALDDPPPGWRVANPAAAKAPMAALLAGLPITVDRRLPGLDWPIGLPEDDQAPERVILSDEPIDSPEDLLIHPPILALGVGCDRNCPPEDLETLVRDTLATANLSPDAIACITSIDLKSDESAVLTLAERLGVPARFFPASVLEAERGRLATPSEVVFREVGCHGVSEGAALAAVGPKGALVVPKAKSARATCAIARAAAPLDPETIGRPRGRLFIVGIGPGEARSRTPAATQAIAASTDLVGYGLYLDLLGDATSGKVRHETGLGHETERARRALELAAEGRAVSLVCSGDAGIYALATLVFELLELEGSKNPAWNRIEITVEPGVSALQVAAARSGAPLNHDFCAISLSDLLTPWPDIERRLKGAALGDFVVAFYNPVSKRRRDQLPKAREILLEHRPAETPVVLARNLGRPEETVRVTTLGALDPEEVDMLTVVLVGSSNTRTVGPWVYTPRGYARKKTGPGADKSIKEIQ
ncbi:MAG: precorrin-3B C(17)-methyltransferase [Rhodospirillum sp.]|nr:precorrin-3B C(17)-methyltransferase [Rhodospirillum sp.]MCF8487909.1 precorrin-3B C(17)-methyltransferase [Rhodospirillum sp.]MCF8501841.1 precorrin-3B C(17)-methyltransferase [Rhodospirillum sp.]